MHHNALGFGPLMAESSISYEGSQGPHAICKGAPDKSGNIMCCIAQESLEKESNTEKEEGIIAENDTRVGTKENWKKLTWELIHRRQNPS